NLLEGTHFNLAHTFARNAELGRKLLERDRIIGQSPGFEDAPFALIKDIECGDQRLMPIVALFALGKGPLLARRIIDEPILPFSALAIIPDRCVKRGVAAKAAVHVDDILLCDAEALGDDLNLIGPQVSVLESGNLALGLAQVEEQLL